LGIVEWMAANPFQFGGLSAGCPAGPSVDSYTALAFTVRELYLNKIAQLTCNNMCLNTLKVAILAIVESMFSFCVLYLGVQRRSIVL
jgi:hypothetical protein